MKSVFFYSGIWVTRKHGKVLKGEACEGYFIGKLINFLILKLCLYYFLF